jgi:hypothetical protein
MHTITGLCPPPAPSPSTPAAGPQKPRPSSVKREEKLKALVGELARRDMDHVAVAAFLQCGQSSALIYLKELLCAGVVARRPPGAGTDPGVHYRIVPDQHTVAAFLRSELPPSNCGAPAFRHDPLLAALFGHAGQPDS